MKHVLSILLLALVLAACEKKAGTTIYTEAERQTVDSIVRSTHGIDSTLMLYKSYKSSGNILGQMVALRQLGKLYREDSQFDDAISYLQQGLQLATQICDTLEMIQALNNIGTNYRRLGSLEEAAHYHQQAVTLSMQMSDQTSMQAQKNRVVSLNGMGNVLMSLGNLEEADSIFHLALEGERSIDSKLGMAINLANIGSIRNQLGLRESARVYYEQSLEMNKLAGSTLGIGLCHIRFGELDEQNGMQDKAISEYQTAYQQLEQIGDEWHWLQAVLKIASLYIMEGKMAEARTYLDMGSQTAVRIGSQEYQAQVYNLYYEFYEKTGNTRLALDNYRKATLLKDSLVSLKKLNNIQDQQLASERLRRQHELEKVQEELALEHSEKKLTRIIAATVLLLVLVVVAYMYYSMHKRVIRLRQLQKAQQAREDAITEITHEFRTPLTVILDLGHELEKSSIENVAKVRSSAKMIVRQGDSLLGLINQIQDISKDRPEADHTEKRHDKDNPPDR